MTSCPLPRSLTRFPHIPLIARTPPAHVLPRTPALLSARPTDALLWPPEKKRLHICPDGFGHTGEEHDDIMPTPPLSHPLPPPSFDRPHAARPRLPPHARPPVGPHDRCSALAARKKTYCWRTKVRNNLDNNVRGTCKEAVAPPHTPHISTLTSGGRYHRALRGRKFAISFRIVDLNIEIWGWRGNL